MLPDAVAAWDKVVELTSVVGDLMRGALAERGLTPARAAVLFVLHEQGLLVQRELSQALRCTPRQVTALVDALEADGWAARRPHPTDRRATLVTLTAKGSAAATTISRERQEAAQRLFGDLPATELAGFVAVADHVLRQVRQISPAPSAARPGGAARGLPAAGTPMPAAGGPTG